MLLNRENEPNRSEDVLIKSHCRHHGQETPALTTSPLRASRGPIILLKLCVCKFCVMKSNIRVIIRALSEETAAEVVGRD